MAEMGIHILLETVENADAQYHQQKQYFVASMHSLMRAFLPPMRPLKKTVVRETVRREGRKRRAEEVVAIPKSEAGRQEMILEEEPKEQVGIHTHIFQEIYSDKETQGQAELKDPDESRECPEYDEQPTAGRTEEPVDIQERHPEEGANVCEEVVEPEQGMDSGSGQEMPLAISEKSSKIEKEDPATLNAFFARFSDVTAEDEMARVYSAMDEEPACSQDIHLQPQKPELQETHPESELEQEDPGDTTYSITEPQETEAEPLMRPAFTVPDSEPEQEEPISSLKVDSMQKQEDLVGSTAMDSESEHEEVTGISNTPHALEQEEAAGFMVVDSEPEQEESVRILKMHLKLDQQEPESVQEAEKEADDVHEVVDIKQLEAGEAGNCGDKPGICSQNNLVSNMRSFLPLVTQQQPAVTIANGKKDVRVKALEAAEIARKQEEKRAEERKTRKLEISKRPLEVRSELERKKLKKLEDEQKRKDEEWKNKRKKFDEQVKVKREQRMEKEKQIGRRRKENEEAKASWFATKEADRKRREEVYQRMKVLEKEQRKNTTFDMTNNQEVCDVPREQSLGLLGHAMRIPKGTAPRKAVSLSTLTNSLNSKSSLNGVDNYLGTPAAKMSIDLKRNQPYSTSILAGEMDEEEEEEQEPVSYEISPYKSSSDDDDDDKENRNPRKPKKPIPRWASKENLLPQLIKQAHVDPDRIFSGATSCSLNEVFGTTGNKKRTDFTQRSGSGDWIADIVTWKEELHYKKSMGFL